MKLPAHLETLQEEVEKLAEQPIRWMESNEINGAMRSGLENGVPVIRYRDFTEDGAAEELMHLKLVLLGIPRLHFPENYSAVIPAVEMLQGVLHHCIIYPQLDKWGHNPRQSECQGILKQLNVIENANLSELEEERMIQAQFAMVYARAKLDCDDVDLEQRTITIFRAKELEAARHSGEEVVQAIQQHAGAEPEMCRRTFERCLRALGLSKYVTVGEPLNT